MNWDYPWMILLLEIIDKWYIMRSDTETFKESLFFCKHLLLNDDSTNLSLVPFKNDLTTWDGGVSQIGNKK